MLFYLRHFGARLRIFGKQGLDEVSCGSLQVFRQIERPTSAFFHDGSWIAGLVLVLERRESSDHLTDKNAEAPNIRLVVVTSAYEDFRGRICRCSAVSSRFIPLDVTHLLREAEIDQFDLFLLIDDDVL